MSHFGLSLYLSLCVYSYLRFCDIQRGGVCVCWRGGRASSASRNLSDDDAWRGWSPHAGPCGRRPRLFDTPPPPPTHTRAPPPSHPHTPRPPKYVGFPQPPRRRRVIPVRFAEPYRRYQYAVIRVVFLPSSCISRGDRFRRAKNSSSAPYSSLLPLFFFIDAFGIYIFYQSVY